MNLFEKAVLEIKYTSRKKTIAIQVDYKKIRVLAPKRTSKRYIHKLISLRKIWIEKKLQEKNEYKEIQNRHFTSGEKIIFLGEEVLLNIIFAKKEHIILEKKHMLILKVCLSEDIKEANEETQSAIIKQKIILWYKQQAENLLIERTAFYANILDVEPKEIKIKSYKSRWGCCSITQEIFYNWKIIMAPIEVINYLVIHELCHILEHNHSSRYWGHVKKLDKDYTTHRNWLKRYGHRLDL